MVEAKTSFPTASRLVFGTHPDCCPLGTESSFLGGEYIEVRSSIINYLYLMLKLGIRRAVLPLPPYITTGCIIKHKNSFTLASTGLTQQRILLEKPVTAHRVPPFIKT
jgi:hypothetical protein